MNSHRDKMFVTAIAAMLMVQVINAAEQPSTANGRRTSRAASEWTTNANAAASSAPSQVHEITPPESRSADLASEPSLGQITTRAGKTYHNVEVIRADPDGIVVQYRPPGGGLGLAKLKFRNLPDELSNQYGYDPEQATAFEEAQLKANAQARSVWAERSEAFSHYRALAMMNRSLAGDSFTIYSFSTQPDGRLTAQGSTGNIYPYSYPWSIGTPQNGAYLNYPYQSVSAMPADPSAAIPDNANPTASVNRKQNSPTVR